MKRALAALVLAAFAGCGGGAPNTAPDGGSLPKSRAETSGFTETSHYADVIAFVDSLQKLGVPMYRTTLGTSTEGRAIPLIVMSRPLVHSPAEAHATGRPIVWVQANIHAGEVEGKEAMLAMLRNLPTIKGPSVLDSIVLLAIPIYNTDGNERFAVQAVNRTEQNGPEMVGQRPNGQMLDLNRDYVKMETPETRASLAGMNSWNPDVFMDLHTTDGSFHGYALTYAPSLNPDALFGGAYARDSMLPAVRARMWKRHQYATYDYGNFAIEYGADVNSDTVKQGWFTYDARPRFGTNYVGVRGRIAVLAEGYSHDPFDRRVNSMYWYVREILSYTAEHGRSIVALSKRADSTVTAWGESPSKAPALALRSTLARSPLDDTVTAEDLARTGDSSLTQPGVPKGLKRTGHFRAQRMPVYVAFEPTLRQKLPFAYAVPPADSAALRVLRAHGVLTEPLANPWPVLVQRYTLDSVRHAERPFQGHHETSVFGRWSESTVTLPPGTVLVRSAQPLGLVAFYLLEPESDDGLVTWNFFDASLAPGKDFPVVRIPGSSGALNVPR